MIDGTTVTPHEHGLVRVFKLDPQLAMDIGHHGVYDRLFKALGVKALDESDIQQLRPSTLEDMTVTDFLRAGYEVNEDDIAAHEFALNGLDNFEGLLLLVRSGAFANRPVTLPSDGEATLIATLREPDSDVTFDPLPNPDPQAALSDAPQKKAPSDAAMSGRVATLALLVLAVLVIVMIWVAS
ncbi:hypothetical protein [Pseudooctadecabacter sp.]|uniref:hypothetical protein n=1 Tax=Pseudooctadecabacter sp. TaxID=1966338 RepID=UPI0025D0786E|nr:hypothetical protein [Pseudooctadecabacter sp.]